jgi:hypothetical protein
MIMFTLPVNKFFKSMLKELDFAGFRENPHEFNPNSQGTLPLVSRVYGKVSSAVDTYGESSLARDFVSYCRKTW